MNLNNFTIKSQQAIETAFQLASSNMNQAVENGHLMKGMLLSDENILPFILKKLGVNTRSFEQIIDSIVKSYGKVGSGNQYLSPDGMKSIQKAVEFAKKDHEEFVSIEHILRGVFASGDQVSKVMADSGIIEKDLVSAINELKKGKKSNSQTAEDTYDSLNRYAINLNERASAGKLDPVIGRDDEIRRILQILSRRTKNNPILIGEPGVGKTAIAEGLAHRIVKGDVPENLKSKTVYSLDMGALIAGAKYKGEFEERLKSVIGEVIDSDGEIVLFVDEIHTLVGAGKSDGAMDAANILKPALARGDLRAIGATTLDEYQKYFEKDKALERRFQPVMVQEPDIADSISILRGLKERYESHHKVRIKDEAIIAAVELSNRYISDRFLPDKAIDLIDEASAKLRMEMNSVPEEIDEIERNIKQLEIEKEALKREGNSHKMNEITRQIADLTQSLTGFKAKWNSEKNVISKIQGIKIQVEEYKNEADVCERNGDYGRVAELRYGKIKEAEQQIAVLQEELISIQGHGALIKEEISADDIAEIVSRWTGIPVNRMLTGERTKLMNLEKELHKRVVGQDEAIQAVADAVRRSRAGIQDAKRPIGSFIFLGTTGVGKTELAKALAETLFDDENQMIRIDMSEYQERHSVSRLIGAPPGYVGYDEGGQLTESVRRKPYSVVLLDEIEKAHPDVFNILLQVLDDGRLTDNKGRNVNFKNTIIIMTSNIGSHIIQAKLAALNSRFDDQTIEQTRKELVNLLKQTIRPEFLNRVDEIIMFMPLLENQIREIVRLQLDQLAAKLSENDIFISFGEDIIEWTAQKGFDIQYGARPVKRLIQKFFLNEISKLIIQDTIPKKTPVLAGIADDKPVFKTIG